MTAPDWSREQRRLWEWSPSKSLFRAIRIYQRHRHRRGPLAMLHWRLAVVRHRLWSVVAGCHIPLACRIGGGVSAPHPVGIVIHAQAVIGVNCTIYQNVTVGYVEGGTPVIGDDVMLGTKSTILGPVTIGDEARIGAHALVICDVPAGSTVMAPLAEIRPGKIGRAGG